MLWLPIPFSACVHINPWTAVQTTPYADVAAVSTLRGSSQGAHSKRGAAHGRGQVVRIPTAVGAIDPDLPLPTQAETTHERFQAELQSGPKRRGKVRS